ncbi:MAG: SPOR domain-containing protein [Thermodesulfobacteriota bacterium]
MNAAEYVQLPGVVHVHSRASSGLYSIEELVTLAKGMGLEVLVMTDQDQVAVEYGIFPLRNLIKKRVERNSVLKLGPEKYLTLITQINQRQRDVLVVPGVQSAPFYYWSGSPIGENLTAHDYRKELLLVGMMAADDYRNLPLLNRGFSTRYIKELLPQWMVFLLSFLMGIYLIFQSGYLKPAGVIIALFSLALLVNHHPFQSSRFDAYHGDRGNAPYQDLIDYVNERGGLIFWAHPESNYSKSGTTLGPIRLMTTSYADSLFETKSYTGFSAIDGDSITLTEPGKKWDQLLNEYCSGYRRHPVWGIAGANFQGEAEGVKLDTFQTVFITKSKSTPHILDALAKGRVYAKQKEKGGGLKLDSFSVEDADSGATAEMGAELNVSSYPVIKFRVASDNNVEHAVKVLLIKGGSVRHQLEGKTPLEFVYSDKTSWASKSYYRLEVQGGSAGKLLSNPIFVDRKAALGALPESAWKPKESESDKAVIMEKETAGSIGPGQKQEGDAAPLVFKIDKAPPVNPPAGASLSDKQIETGSVKGDLSQSSDAESEKRAIAAKGTPKLADAQLKITGDSVPFSLQVASLPSFELAQNALQGFQQMNLPAYHVKVSLGDKGTWWRLYIGYYGAREEAMAARETYHLPEAMVQKTPYANLVGVYNSMKEISRARQQLGAMEYSPYVIRKSADSYHLYVGAFVTLKGAKDLQRELKKNGIASEIAKR